ncbi:MAG TPA: hypothetical protein VK629_08020 [Steroidobacteraceae bacterium]|nr:hypothetical protein [Steroidobacteraceae bacterium]
MSKQPKVPISKQELRTRLTEQLNFLLKSANEYDKGDTSEARRLSVSLRVLLHNHGQSRALLQLLGIRDTIAFLDTCGPLSTTNLLTDYPMVMMEFGADTRYKARLGELYNAVPNRKIMFEKWWNNSVIRNPQVNVTFSRRELVLSVADQDGGAHVDPEIDAKYARLSKTMEFGALETKDGVIRPIPLIELAHIRQITYEVLTTVATKISYAMPQNR